MVIADGLNTKTTLEHLVFLSEKNTISVCRELGITPQQFTDWIKFRRPIPEERLKQLESYFGIPADMLADERRFAKRLSKLDGLELELLIVKNKLRLCASPGLKQELEYRISTLETEHSRQLRITRLAAILEQGDEAVMHSIDMFLDKLEGKS